MKRPSGCTAACVERVLSLRCAARLPSVPEKCDSVQPPPKPWPAPPWLPRWCLSAAMSSPEPRRLPWMRQAGGQGPPSSQQQLWQALQAALATGDLHNILQALQALSQARHSLGAINETEAALLYDVLVCASAPPAPSTPPGFVQAVVLAQALSLLARWSLQLQRSQSSTYSPQLLQNACGWVLQHSRLLCASLPHTTGAAVLFLGTAYPRCPNAHPGILSCVCALLSQSSHHHQPWPQGSPLASIASCQDACMGCELLMQHLILVPATTSITHPINQLVAALLQGMTHVIAGLMACTIAHDQTTPAHTLHWHLPATHLVLTHLSSPAVPDHMENLSDVPSIQGGVCSQVSMRIIASVAASLERWAAWWAQVAPGLPAAHSAAQSSVIREVAGQVHATCSQGVQHVFAHASQGPAIARAACCHPSNPQRHVSAAAGPYMAVFVATSRTSQPHSPIPPLTGDIAHEERMKCQGVAQLCGGLLVAAGLLQGLAVSLRTTSTAQKHPAQLASLKGAVQPAVNALGASVQVCLAAVCKQAADEAASAGRVVATSQSSATSAPANQWRLRAAQPGQRAQDAQEGPGYWLSVLPRWSAGYVQGHLVDGLANTPLHSLVAVPGPLAVHLPAMVVEAVLGCVMSCDPLLGLVLQHAPAAAAGAWLHETASDVMHMRVASLARCFIQAVQSIPPGVQASMAADAGAPADPQQAAQGMCLLDGVLSALQQQAAHASRVYACVVMLAPEGWLTAVSESSSGLRDLLDKLYVVACTPLASVYTAWPHRNKPQAACRVLGVLSALHFCSVQLPVIAELMQRLVPEMLTSPQACTHLLDSLPCYEALMQPVQHLHPLSPSQLPSYPQQGSAGSAAASTHADAAPRWMADHILGASLLLLLPIASAAACQAEDVQTAVHQLLPLLFVLLKHPQTPLAAAAHTAMASLVSRLCEMGQSGLATSTLPYYVERSLQQLWTTGQMEAMEAALPRMLSSLPVGSTTTLYCLQYITGAAVQWFEQHPDAAPLDFSGLYQQQQQGTGNPAGQGQGSKTDGQVSPEARLMSMVAGLLLVCDWAVLPAVTSQLTQVLAAAGQAVSPAGVKPQQVALMQYLYDMLLRSDDYVRKRVLMDWLQGLTSRQAGTQQPSRRVWGRLLGRTRLPELPGQGVAAGCDIVLN